MHDINTSLAHLNPVTRWTIDRSAVDAAVATLAEPDRDALLWIDYYGRANNLTPLQLGARLQSPGGGGYSKDTVYQILTGRQKSIAPFIGAVQRLRATAISSPLEFPFVETIVAKDIADYTNLCHEQHKMGLIIGESQTGKSRALKEYARRMIAEGKDVLYFQLPVGGHKSKVIDIMADRRGVAKNTNARRELALAESITAKTLIIADEIQQCTQRAQTGGRSLTERVNTIEYFRYLRDTCSCSVVLVGTTEALRMLNGTGIGHDNHYIFIQTLKRAFNPFILDNNPSRADLAKFAKLVGLDPAVGDALTQQDDVAVNRGLEMWLTYLLNGSQRAKNQGRAVCWADVLAAISAFTGAAK